MKGGGVPKYIFVIGGVMSSVGKGIVSSSLAFLIKSKGFKITTLKADPYINIDAGTMNPTEHGEVFVTEDGDETDQDMGNYERFLNQNLTSLNYMTTGRVYQTVIQKERNLEYSGKCVEVVPHIPRNNKKNKRSWKKREGRHNHSRNWRNGRRIPKYPISGSSQNDENSQPPGCFFCSCKLSAHSE